MVSLRSIASLRFTKFDCFFSALEVAALTCSGTGLGKSFGITLSLWSVLHDRITSLFMAGVTRASTFVVSPPYVAWNNVEPEQGTLFPSMDLIFFFFLWSSTSPQALTKSSATRVCWQPVSGNTCSVVVLPRPRLVLYGQILTSFISGVGSESSWTLALLQTTFIQGCLMIWREHSKLILLNPNPNRGDTLVCQDGLRTRKLCQSPISISASRRWKSEAGINSFFFRVT